ncbi:hypothetical protein [Sinomonas atrocyanea]|uniref:hypothetical protein n=1 Tax=Sinomonas atrocyanea TaxID=37927 RepID=UPI002867372E|nr:hypothetical protein [Sinomonas atrocyanea]MDR6623484.1 hypothetical protein [Sinomonas atrocyanea]
MTELAYMIREDWGQHGKGMVPQSAVIRKWLGEPPYLFVTCDLKKFQGPNSADRELVGYIAGTAVGQTVGSLLDLQQVLASGDRIEKAMVVMHPYEQRDCDLLRELVEKDLVAQLFVMVWSPADLVRSWLDGMTAKDLHTQAMPGASDPILLEAAKCIVHEQYNGLSTGNGKAAIVQLVRAFAAQGYSVEPGPWLRAFFAAGGEFRHAEALRKLVKEIQRGTKHRVKDRFRPNIFEILASRSSSAE